MSIENFSVDQENRRRLELAGLKSIEVDLVRLGYIARAQTEIAKWMIATLAAVHLGGIAIAVNSRPDVIINLKACIWSFLVGLFLSLLCGLFTYLNYCFYWEYVESQLSIRKMFDETAWLSEDDRTNFRLAWTTYAAVGCGLASALTVLVTAYLAM